MSNQMLVSLGNKLATRMGVEGGQETLNILKATAFKVKDKIASDDQLAALLIVADQYELNPWTKEIYAFPDKSGGIVPVVGVDGWSRIINEHPQMNGIDFKYSEDLTTTKNGKICHEWIECIIYRKDREKPTIIREYFDEVYRELSYDNPWKTHPKRFHRHKTLIQCARVAFGFAGIYDQDEADRIVNGEKDITSMVELVNIQEELLAIKSSTNGEELKAAYTQAWAKHEGKDERAQINQAKDEMKSLFKQQAAQALQEPSEPLDADWEESFRGE